MTARDRHLTALDLDRLVLDEIAPDDRSRIEAHAARCPACAARRSAHVEHAERFRGGVFARTAPALAARRRPWLRLRGARGLGWLAVPAAAALLLVVRAGGPLRRSPPPVPEPVIGAKGGGALLHVFARRAGAGPDGAGPVVRVADGARLAAGDALRFVLDPTGLPCVLIASVDGAGHVSIYYPFHGERSALVDGRAAVSVPGSIVLDDAPGPERLYVIYSERPIEARAVRGLLARTAAGGPPAIRAGARLPIGGSVQATLLFEKEADR